MNFKVKLFIVFCFVSVSLSALAQTTKPAVLVVGNGNAAAAAAIQSAVSGVKTTLLLQSGGFDIAPLRDELHSGVQATFLKKINESKGVKDSLAITSFDKLLANDVLTKWTDSLKNLTVIKNVVYSKGSRSGNSWTFKLSDGQTIKPRVLVIANDEKLKTMLSIATIPVSEPVALDYSTTLHRTSVASGIEIGGKNSTIFSMYNLFLPLQENLIWLKSNDGMIVGQAAGATAAYAGFFGTKLSEANLKTIQGELINYKLALMPFSDIVLTDSNWKAIQFVGLTGMLKANINNGRALFLPDQQVKVDEVKQPIKDFFYKAQIWFDDHNAQELNLKSTIELVSYVGNKSPENTLKEVEKKWKNTYKLSSDFDLNKTVTRREFAILLQDYLPPFNVNVDKNGKVVR